VPKQVGAKLLIEASLPIVGMNDAASAIAVIFVDETAYQVGVFTPTDAAYEGQLNLRYVHTVSSLSSVKASLRFGPQTGYTATINMGWIGHTFSTNVITLLTVKEIAQ